MVDMNESNALFGASLKRHRKQMKMSKTALSEATGVHYQTIAAYERGTVNPSLFNMKLIAAALNITLDDLAGGTA